MKKLKDINKKFIRLFVAGGAMAISLAVVACSNMGMSATDIVSDTVSIVSENLADEELPYFVIDENAVPLHAVPDDWDKIDEQYSELTHVRDNIYMNEDERFTELTVSLNNIIDTGRISGTLVVATDHEIIYASGTGAYDIYGDLVSMDTTYGIGSINKTFTSA